ncbi:MAG: AbrB/MazE/SpoVT family DNA-binding domain-containing protein [Acetobacteraceae bacterium]
MTHVTIGRWGKNLALRIPTDIASEFGLSEGNRLEIEAMDDTILIRRPRPRYTAQDLFAGKRPEEWRALYAGAYDWGPDVGREIVEE